MSTSNAASLRLALTAAVSLALAGSLSACGGGNVRPAAPAAAPAPAAPTVAGTTPDTAPSSGGTSSGKNTTSDNSGDNGGNPQTSGGGSSSGDDTAPGTASPSDGSTAPQPAGAMDGSYSSYVWPAQNQLLPTHVTAAHDDGFTGKGVKVAVMDSGIDPAAPMFQHLDYHFHSFLGANASASASDTTGHGSNMIGLLAGAKVDGFAGGVAPDASVYVGQICDGTSGSCHMTAAQPAYFLKQGVRLFSYSMGNGAATLARDDAHFADFVSSSFQPVVDAGGLVVWAAGNGGVDSLSGEAGAPNYLPGLEKGWLVAVNVALDHADGHVTGLHEVAGATGEMSGSAECGAAMDWCLAAPGYAQTPVQAGTAFTTGFSEGTSNAAAVISGVAALTWQAFPWMSGHNIQQTVLTTATHLGGGDPDQPNATYGWGLVNADKAVHGPAQFVDTFDADVGDFSSVFSNAIGGAGSLVLSGNRGGQLELSADNTFSGGTRVLGASLFLSGSLASNVTVQGGRLVGFGTVHGDVINTRGNVTSTGPNAGRGLTITGNYAAAAESSTTVVLGRPLTVGKQASLDGGLVLERISDTYTPKASETLLTAANVKGTFASVNAGQLPMYSAKLAYTDTDVTATLTRTSVTMAAAQSSPVLAQTSQGVEKALDQADSWSQTDYAGHQTFLTTAAHLMSAPTRAALTASVASLSGQAYGTIGAIEALQSRHVDDAVAMRQNGMLPGAGIAFWSQAMVDDGGLSEAGYASARYRGNGMLFGMDVPVNAHLAAGVFGGINHMNAQLDALAGRVREHDRLGGVYARYGFDDGSYLAGRASWTRATLEVNRTALVGTGAKALKGERTDGIGRLTLEAGHTFGVVTPYVAVSAMHLDQDGFSEKGGAGFGLTAPSQSQQVSMADLGARFAHHFSWAGGVSTLTGYAAWRRVLSGARFDFTAALSGAPNARFAAPGQSLARNVGQVGISMDTRVNPHWDWSFRLDAQGAAGRYHAFSANLGLRYRL